MGASPDISQPPGEHAVPLMLPTEAATALRVSVWTVYRLMDDGYLTDVRIGPKQRRCRADEINAMAAGTPLGVSTIPSQRTTR